IAKPAIHKAAVTYKRIQWIVASNRHLPLQPNSLDAILCLFGFACFDVFAHALKPGGVVLMIDPDKDHLLELRQVVYPMIKEKTAPTPPPWAAAGLIQRDETRLTYRPATLDQQQLHNLILMTPHVFRAPAEGKERLAQLPALDITVAVTLRVLQKAY
ncbi:MAG: methylase, partial [Halothiobacillaceae bacterium]